MNIELEEVVVQDVTDDALEQAAGGTPQGGNLTGHFTVTCAPQCAPSTSPPYIC